MSGERSTAATRGPVQLLAQHARAGASGILSATRGKLRRLYCLHDGWFVHAASNMIEDLFDEHLVQRKLLTAGERAVAKLEADKQGVKFARYVETRRLVKPDELKNALQEWATNLLHTALEEPETEYTFTLGRPNLDAELTLRLSCMDLIVGYAMRYPKTMDEVRVAIGPPDMRPVVAARFRKFLATQQPQGATRFLVEQCDGNLDLAMLTSQSPHPTSETLRTLYGLLQFGVLEPAAAKPKVTGVAAEQATRAETLARLDRATNADHYAILGVMREATEAEIRAGYYVLARRFHPDRFRSGPLQDLLGRIEAFFTQVTEAYNTLADPERRTAYNEELAQATGPDEREQERETSALARQNYIAAKALLAKNRFQDAVKFLENAVQIDGTQAVYFLELGRVLAQNPRYRKEAEQNLLRAAELDPAVPESYLALGQLYGKQDRAEEAVKMFREVLRWDPGNLEAERELKQLGASAGDGGRFGGLFKG